MKGRRKNLKRASEEQSITLQDGQSIMQVVSLIGSNLIECAGSFVIVDESGKEKAIKDGGKVVCIVNQVLFFEQVRALRKSSEWPEIFKSTNLKDANGSLERHAHTSHHEENADSDSDDDGLPPLEDNTNRIKLLELQMESESEFDSGSDTDT